MRIVLQVRRFKCVDTGCARATFVEQVDDLTTRYGRHTVALRGVLESIGLALAGRAGARLAARLGLRVHRTTLLRLVRALPDPEPGAVTGVGVDDFALRRGHRYGTVIIDIDSHRPLDVLADRTSDTLADWLREHPDLQVVCRDRAGAYAEAARIGAPAGDPGRRPVAPVAQPDRGGRQDRGRRTRRPARRARRRSTDRARPNRRTDGAGPDTRIIHRDGAGRRCRGRRRRRRRDGVVTAVPEGPLVVRTRERHAAVARLRADGYSISQIARELGLNRRTVRRFARRRQCRGSAGQGRTAGQPARPVQAVSARAVQRRPHRRRRTDRRDHRARLPRQRQDRAPLPAPVPRRRGGAATGAGAAHRARGHRVDDLSPRPPRHRQRPRSRAASWTAARSSRPPAARSATFAEMLTGRHGDRLEDWMREIDATGAAPLRSFAAGSAHRPRRRHQRAHPALQLRPRRRHRHPDQDTQTANVRPRELRPTPQTNPAPRVMISRHRHGICDRANFDERHHRHPIRTTTGV